LWRGAVGFGGVYFPIVPAKAGIQAFLLLVFGRRDVEYGSTGGNPGYCKA